MATEVKPRLAALMEDVFGNYVIQKLLERAGPQEKAWMADRICKDTQKPHQLNRAVVLSKHQYGCRVVQKALEVGHQKVSYICYEARKSSTVSRVLCKTNHGCPATEVSHQRKRSFDTPCTMTKFGVVPNLEILRCGGKKLPFR